MMYSSIEDAMRYMVETNSKIAINRIPAKKSQPANSIEKLLADKVECLATILRDIQHKIDKRYVLSSDVMELIDHHYRYIKTKFFELQQWPLSSDRAIELRRSGLEGTLDTLLNEKRREQVQCERWACPT